MWLFQHLWPGLVVLSLWGGGGKNLPGCWGLDVRFEDPTTGFFLRDSKNVISSAASSSTLDSISQASTPTTSIILGTNEIKAKEVSSGSLGDHSTLHDDILHTESFTVVRSSQPVTVRAEYGPFESSHMVPTQYLVPDLLEEPNVQDDSTDLGSKKKAALITDFKPHQLDLSAHLVTNEVPKDNPVLRVLFHLGNHHNVVGGHHKICILLTATKKAGKFKYQQQQQDFKSPTVSNICSPKDNSKKDDGTCLGQLTLPSSWWPSVTPMLKKKKRRENSNIQDETLTTETAKFKQPKVLVDVKYSVFEMSHGYSCDTLKGRIPVVPETPLGAITLSLPDQSYHQLAKDELVHMLMPQAPLYPNSQFYVPVFLEQEPLTSDEAPITALTIKCRTRSGLRILDVEQISDAWTIRVDINGKGTLATVTAFKKSLQTTIEEASTHPPVASSFGPQEIFNWLLLVDDRDYDVWDQPRISWHIKYQRPEKIRENDQPNVHHHQADESMPQKSQKDFTTTTTSLGALEGHFHPDSYRLRAKMSIKKDEVQAVIPIAKHKDLMNLAILTGRQVSRPLKVFIVSQAGDVADVTLHSSCSSVDQSVLKVTSSCTSVYVDGSENRGALAAEIDIKYGSSQYMGKAVFTVWMPEIPLNIVATDTRLSQIKGWKVPQFHGSSSSTKTQNLTSQGEEATFGSGEKCNLRYQQSKIRVFSKFLAQDPDSGRTEYFPSRSTELDVTELVMGHGLRISNSGVASLRNNIVQGLNAGRTEIKVVSPITGKEIGMLEMRVAKNRETIRGMNVRILSGLRLEVQADPTDQGRYTLKTAYSQLLRSKYQEGLLDIELLMSDDTRLPLRDVAPEDYYLAIKSLDSEVIALAPSRDARFPRVIAVGSGQGQLLRTSLELVDACIPTQSSNLALAIQLADVDVKIHSKKKPTASQAAQSQNTITKWPPMTKNNNNNADDIGTILSNIALRDDHSYYKEDSHHQTSLRQHAQAENDARNYFLNGHLTPLEIGMYILLAVFCASMAVFMASCFVYASKIKRQEYPLNTSFSILSSNGGKHSEMATGNGRKTPVQNAHDWVWLGKSTLDHAASVHSSQRLSQRSSYAASSEINVIANPVSDECCPNSGLTGSQLCHPERIPLSQISSQYPKQQYHHHRMLPLPATYENLPRRPRQMPIPGNGNNNSTEKSKRKRRLLPAINSATYTKKVAEFSKNSPPGILPVGYPVFITSSASGSTDYQPETAEELSPLTASLPDPENFPSNPTTANFPAPLRQSPASALPPFIPITDEDENNTTTNQHVYINNSSTSGSGKFSVKSGVFNDPLENIEHENDIKNSDIIKFHQEEHQSTKCFNELDFLNPDIHRPSPPRTGASRLFENPFDLTDEDSARVEVEQKLSPSHVFESTCTFLEEPLIESAHSHSESAVEKVETAFSLRPLDSRTFVIKRSSNKASSSTASSPAGTVSPCNSSDVNANDESNNEDLDLLTLGANETTTNPYGTPCISNHEDEVGMDYDNLMAYFDSLKESTA